MILFVEQALNGLQLGVMLFLIAAGLTLVLGILNLVNLAHGSLVMTGAFLAAAVALESGSYLLGLIVALPATALIGALLEWSVLRHLYKRDHLDQVLATFGLLLFANGLTKVIYGPRPWPLDPPSWLAGTVEIVPGLPYPAMRLAVLAIGLAVSVGLYFLVARTQVGRLIRAGASDREMLGALGVDVRRLFTLIFALGAGLAALAGVLAGPNYSVEIGMGENFLILAFVVIVIGGIGSIKGAFVGALVVGIADTMSRAFMPKIMRLFLDPSSADGAAAALSSMSIYLVMAVVLVLRPRGLYGDQV